MIDLDKLEKTFITHFTREDKDSLIAELRALRADNQAWKESLNAELAENIEIFNLLGLHKPEDFGYDTSTKAIVRLIQKLQSENAVLRDKNGMLRVVMEAAEDYLDDQEMATGFDLIDAIRRAKETGA